MLSRTVEYALRATVHLAYVAPASSTTQKLAEATKVPSAYLSKVLQGLAKAGIVRSQRGIGGGISLQRTPAELTILDVVNAVEPIKRIKTCPLEIDSHGSHLCPLHSKLDEAIAHTESAFQSTTLQDIIDDPSQSKPLCDVSSDANKLYEL